MVLNFRNIPYLFLFAIIQISNLKNLHAQSAFPNCPNPENIDSTVNLNPPSPGAERSGGYSVLIGVFSATCNVSAGSYYLLTGYRMETPQGVIARQPIGYSSGSNISFTFILSDTPATTSLSGSYRISYQIAYYLLNNNNTLTRYTKNMTANFTITDTSTPPASTPITRPTIAPTPINITPPIPSASVNFSTGALGLVNGQTISGNRMVEFTYSAGQNFNVQSFDFNFNGRYVSQAGAQARGLPFDTTTIPNGNIQVFIRATGVVPSTGAIMYFFSPTYTVNVQNASTVLPTPTPSNNPLPGEDRDAPIISVTGLPAVNQSVSGILRFTVSASDPSGLKSIEVFAFGSRLFSRDFSSMNVSDSLIFSQNFEIDTSRYANDFYGINITAIDRNSVGRNPNGNPAVTSRTINVNNSGSNTPVPTVLPERNTPIPYPTVRPVEPTPSTPPTGTPTPQPVDTLGQLINLLSGLILQMTELMKQLLAAPVVNVQQAKIAKSMANNLTEITKVNKEQFESMEQTKMLPDQTKAMKKSLNKALKLAQKKNDFSALKIAQKEMNKANRQIKKVVESLS